MPDFSVIKSYFTVKGAQAKADYYNAGRENGPWVVVRSGRKFRRYTLDFNRPENY